MCDLRKSLALGFYSYKMTNICSAFLKVLSYLYQNPLDKMYISRPFPKPESSKSSEMGLRFLLHYLQYYFGGGGGGSIKPIKMLKESYNKFPFTFYYINLLLIFHSCFIDLFLLLLLSLFLSIFESQSIVCHIFLIIPLFLHLKLSDKHHFIPKYISTYVLRTKMFFYHNTIITPKEFN